MYEDMHPLLAKYFSGSATAEEEGRVRDWVKLHPDNRAEFELLQRMWTATAPPVAAPFNTDAAWTRVDAQLRPSAKNRGMARVYRITLAAAACLVLGLGLWWFLRPSDDWRTFSASGSVQTLALEDGSRVHLRPGASLRYPARFSGERRQVELQGEGFFEVHRDPAHPFVIDAGPTEIRVLGTSFNVKPVGESVELVVKTGLVQFSASGKEGLKVGAGERAVYRGGAFDKTANTDPNFDAWQTGKLVFNNTPLPEALRTLADYYGVEIRMDARDAIPLSNTRVTLDLHRQPLAEALKQLSLITSYLVQEKGAGVYEISIAR